MIQPLVTIVIPSYNCSNYIIETLESVKAQTYKNIELVIVDDCSTDDSREKIKNWIVSSALTDVKFIVNEKNLGVVKTSNILLRNTNGKYYTLLSCDDLLMPDKTQKQVDLFESLSPDTALIFSNVKIINEKSELIGEDYFERIGCKKPQSGMIFRSLLEMNFIASLSVLIRTDFVKEIGGYDESLAFEDWDMWVQLSRKYPIVYVDDFTSLYRIHARSIMQNPANIHKLNNSYIMMYKKYLGEDKSVNELIYSKLAERSIYSYYMSDAETAKGHLLWSIKHHFSFKVWVYYVLISLGIRLPFRG